MRTRGIFLKTLFVGALLRTADTDISCFINTTTGFNIVKISEEQGHYSSLLCIYVCLRSLDCLGAMKINESCFSHHSFAGKDLQGDLRAIKWPARFLAASLTIPEVERHPDMTTGSTLKRSNTKSSKLPLTTVPMKGYRTTSGRTRRPVKHKGNRIPTTIGYSTTSRPTRGPAKHTNKKKKLPTKIDEKSTKPALRTWKGVFRAANCSEVKRCSSTLQDGEYWLFPRSVGGSKVKIYCSNMATTPREYISLKHVTQSRNITWTCGRRLGGWRGHRHKRSRRRGGHGGPGAQRCGKMVMTGRPPNTPPGLHTTEYYRLRINLEQMEIDLHDKTFIRTFPRNLPPGDATVGGPLGVFGGVCTSGCSGAPPTSTKIALYETSFMFSPGKIHWDWAKKGLATPWPGCQYEQEWFVRYRGCGLIKLLSPIKVSYYKGRVFGRPQTIRMSQCSVA